MTLLVSPLALAAVDALDDSTPSIAGISPSSGVHGTRITITGEGFDLQNNDIGFTKMGKDIHTTYTIGYVNNVPSPDGKTLVFELPQHVGVCAFSTMEPDVVCIEIALLLEAGDYEVFVVNKNGMSDAKPFTILKQEGDLTATIPTRVGELTLTYRDGVTTLHGILQRSTPCVDWQVDVTATTDMPVSNVMFHIYDKNKDEICRQVVGEPQEINTEMMQTSERTKYGVMLEDELVFSGSLTERDATTQIVADMKIKKHSILLAIKNNGEIPIEVLEIDAGVIRYAKAIAWMDQQVDENSIRLHTDSRPISKDRTLVVLLVMDDRYSGIAWNAYDANNNMLASGAMIP